MISKVESAIGLLFLIGLSIISNHNYLLFHIIVELFSVIIAFGIFSLIWHGKRFINNGYYILLGIAYAFVGVFDFFHAISYKNMGILLNDEGLLAVQFWIAARYFESISLFIAPFFIKSKKLAIATVIYAVIFIGTLLSIFWFKNFPACYVEGMGLTNFKIYSEYIISIFFAASLLHLYYRKQYFDRKMLQWMALSIVFSVGAELCFTMYVGLYDVMNIVGHYFKVLSYYFIYKAFIETSFSRPYDSLFKKLQENERLFRTYFNLPLMGRAIIYWQTQKWVQVNEKFYELLAHSEESLSQQTWKSLTHPEDWLSEQQQFKLIEQNCIDKFSCEKRFLCGDGSILEAEISLACIRNKNLVPEYFVVIVADISQRKDAEREKELVINDLKEAISNIKILQTLLPICPSCHSVKDDHGYWHRVEDYINEYTPMKIEYTFCDKCLKKHHPELLETRRTITQYHDYLKNFTKTKTY